MAVCETPDFIYPMTMNIFYPIVEQGPYGNVKRQWMHDKTAVCSLSSGSGTSTEEVKPNINITQDTIIVGRVKSDIRVSSKKENNSINNILVTNICDRSGNSIYSETAGPRAGKPTLFEVASNEPVVGPFGLVEYYKVVLRRSENQAVEI
jgi:hypothetical protein